jgi:CheY-like chemotaxis protein
LIAILSDINMPGMDGLTLLGEMLTLLGEIKQRFPDVPVMMVTAYDDEARKRRASHLGASPNRWTSITSGQSCVCWPM